MRPRRDLRQGLNRYRSEARDSVPAGWEFLSSVFPLDCKFLKRWAGGVEALRLAALAQGVDPGRVGSWVQVRGGEAGNGAQEARSNRPALYAEALAEEGHLLMTEAPSVRCARSRCRSWPDRQLVHVVHNAGVLGESRAGELRRRGRGADRDGTGAVWALGACYGVEDGRVCVACHLASYTTDSVVCQ